MPEIFIDGDACPVKNEIIRVAERHQIKINIASNSWLRLGTVNTDINQIMVEKKPDAADDWIAEHVAAQDIVITSDIPLASRCLQKQAYVLRPNGSEFTEDNIGTSLGLRDLNNYLREIGEKSDYHRSFSPQNRSNFLSALETIVQRAKTR